MGPESNSWERPLSPDAERTAQDVAARDGIPITLARFFVAGGGRVRDVVGPDGKAIGLSPADWERRTRYYRFDLGDLIRGPDLRGLIRWRWNAERLHTGHLDQVHEGRWVKNDHLAPRWFWGIGGDADTAVEISEYEARRVAEELGVDLDGPNEGDLGAELARYYR